MNVESLHDVAIILHSVSATISFIVGGLLLFSMTRTSNEMLFGFYWWSLAGMVLLLAGAILVYWAQYSPIERIVFPGLLALAIFMFYRAQKARRLLREQPADWRHNYVEHIGFTLISLFEGFIIVSGLNSGFPGWLVALVAILGVLLGRWTIHVAQRRTA